MYKPFSIRTSPVDEEKVEKSSSDSEDDGFSKTGGNCKYCNKDLPTGRRLSLHEKFCPRRKENNQINPEQDNQPIEPLPTFQTEVTEPAQEVINEVDEQVLPISNEEVTLQSETCINEMLDDSGIQVVNQREILKIEPVQENDEMIENEVEQAQVAEKRNDQNHDQAKTEAVAPMASIDVLNGFNVDAYIASNAAEGNLDVIEVDSVENFKLL